MFRVFPHHASAAALLELLMDVLLGFAAVLLAAMTVDVLPDASLVGVLTDWPTLLSAAAFAVVMALLQTFLGLYRHANIPLASVLWRLAVAGDADSYRYLAESIRMHPGQAELKAMMKTAGFGHVDVHNMTGGVVALHMGIRC